jgi:hypothetical protein
MFAWRLPRSSNPQKPKEKKMDIEAEQKYEHTIDQIIVQLENLIMDILLTSINRLNINYERLLLNAKYYKNKDKTSF